MHVPRLVVEEEKDTIAAIEESMDTVSTIYESEILVTRLMPVLEGSTELLESELIAIVLTT